MNRIEALQKQIKHLRKRHWSKPGTRSWVFELEGTLNLLQKGIERKKLLKPCNIGGGMKSILENYHD